jgi:RimJ/RimL family protein N-acetyltransferase
MNESTFAPNPEKKKIPIKGLEDFDMQYFLDIAEGDTWIALDSEDYQNQRYFTVMGENGERLGIVGVFDTEQEKNVTHTVVDPKFRGNRLGPQFKYLLMEKLGLPYITLTVNRNNEKSIKSIQSIISSSKEDNQPFEIKKISGDAYEEEFDKHKFILKRKQAI